MRDLGSRVAVLATALLTLAATGSAVAHAGPGSRHPYFDDQGTLSWYRTFEEARAAARAEGKLIFVEFGRRECHNCRVLVQSVLPAPGVRERLSSLCVGFAAECDDPDPRVDAMFRRHLVGATLLPFAAFTTSDLEWVTGWGGIVGADVLAQHLRLAEARRPASPLVAAVAAPPPEPVRSAPPPPPAIRVASPVTVAAVPLPTGAKPAAAPAPRAADAVVRAPSPATPAPCLVPAPSAPTGRAAPAMPSADLLPRARAASVAGHHGEALALWREARARPDAGTADQWAPVVARADVWAEESLRAAVRAAREGRYADAQARLASVRLEVQGRPAAAEAVVGQRALERLQALDGASSSWSAGASEFQGTRWTRMFPPLR